MKTVFKKSFAVVAAAVLLVSVYVIAGVLIFANKLYIDINAGNLKETAVILKDFTPAGVFTDTAAAAEWGRHVSTGFGGADFSASPYRITLISRNGQVMFDTGADSADMENHLDRTEFQDAVKNGIGTARRRSATLGQHFIYSAVAIEDSSHTFAGVLRLSLLVPGFFTRLLNSALPFLIGGLVIIIGTCAGLYHFSRRFSHSIETELDAKLAQKTAELKVKSEEAEAENRHRAVILGSMFEGLITLDSSLNIVLANSRLCALFGIDETKNVYGMSLVEFSHSAELEAVAGQVLSTGRPHELTFKRYVSGAEQHFQVFAAPLETETARGVVMALRDISRLVKLEQVRRDFAANVSHELRTPIQVIQGFAENILDSFPDDTEQIRHFTEIIMKNALCMENLTNDLLTLVSLEDESGARAPIAGSVLAPLMAEAVEMVAAAAQKKNITISISCPSDLEAELHCPLFVQALVNLLDNSIKYSDNGSPIQVSAAVENQLLIIEVKDRGIGIPAEHIDRIFERFYRVDRARSRTEGGTGLGLSIVRHIALLHGGTVEAESHAGEGSILRLRLPIEQPPHSPHDQAAPV